MPTAPQDFGGDWTSDKLERVRKYLVAYATIMKDKRLRFAYIDAFAGTGYRTQIKSKEQPSLLFPELVDEESQDFLDGSARIALQVKPRFNRYIFIEKDPERYAELEKLREEFPHLKEDITLENADANTYLQDLCLKRNWRGHRAVLFLDPYGMQVPWATIEAIAATKAIDLWILFPLGVAVNRMVTKSGQMSGSWRRKLDIMFGATDWYDAFYKPESQSGLFDQETQMVKVSDFESIGQYFVNRLKTIFPGVAANPRPLFNSRNIPLFLLCFAAGNPKGAPTAIRIAQDILRR
jgi:three-Cys-motif partner protein